MARVPWRCPGGERRCWTGLEDRRGALANTWPAVGHEKKETAISPLEINWWKKSIIKGE